MASHPTIPVYTFPQPITPDAPLVTLSYANGFLPPTYAESLKPIFNRFRVISPHLRPMWTPAPPTKDLHDWAPFGDDLLTSLDQIGAPPGIAIGHSVGAIAVLYAAVAHPERFRGVILLDPTLLPRKMLRMIWLARLLRQDGRNGLAQGARKRGNHWESIDAAYTYFRGKKLFTRWTDQAVRTYAESITAPDPTGGIALIYPPEWEARIYETIPTTVWRLPPRLTIPTLVIRGALSDTFLPEGKARFARIMPRAALIDVNGAGHLVAQEQPAIVGQHIAHFADQIFG